MMGTIEAKAYSNSILSFWDPDLDKGSLQLIVYSLEKK